LVRPAFEHFDGPPAPVVALRGQPGVELRGAGHAEPLEEFPLHEACRARVVSRGHERLERVRIELDRAGEEAHLRGVGLEAADADGFPPLPDRLIERMTRVVFRFVGPQQSDEMLARPGTLGGPCEVHQQRKMFAPKERRRRLPPVHADLDRTECADDDHKRCLQPIVIARRAALSARAR